MAPVFTQYTLTSMSSRADPARFICLNDSEFPGSWAVKGKRGQWWINTGSGKPVCGAQQQAVLSRQKLLFRRGFILTLPGLLGCPTCHSSPWYTLSKLWVGTKTAKTANLGWMLLGWQRDEDDSMDTGSSRTSVLSVGPEPISSRESVGLVILAGANSRTDFQFKCCQF